MFEIKSLIIIIFLIISILITLCNTKTINSNYQNGLQITSKLSYFLASSRVIGGKEAKPHSAPYIVSIQDTATGNHLCGGVILNENWILTAAHCLNSESQAKKLRLVAGAHDIEKNEKTTQIRKIDYYKNHDLYNGGINPYDIALIYTKEKFTFNTYVKAISLPSAGANPTGTAELYGWGSISSTQSPLFPAKLQYVDMPIIDVDTCRNALGNQGYKLHKTNLCTGPLTGGKSICQADSGGPLVQSGKVIGIVSWGKTPCGQPNSPSVYVNVSAFIDWIKKIQTSKK